jgi:hypothetical protein
MSKKNWFVALAATGVISGCEVESEGGPRGAAISDRFADATAVSWTEDAEMVTEIRASEELVARAHWDFEAGTGFVVTTLATLDLEVPNSGWTEHEANAFVYDLWQETRELEGSIGEPTALSPDGSDFRDDDDCTISYDCCNVYISCSVCGPAPWGESCTVVGSGGIPLPDCICTEV